MSGQPSEFLLTIGITDDDIANGKRNDCYKCPAALAIRRAITNFFNNLGAGYVIYHVSVSEPKVVVSAGVAHGTEVLWHADVTRDLCRFIEFFDMDLFTAVVPGEHILSFKPLTVSTPGQLPLGWGIARD